MPPSAGMIATRPQQGRDVRELLERKMLRRVTHLDDGAHHLVAAIFFNRSG